MKINNLQAFFIDGHPELTDADLAKATGLTTQQVKSRKLKVKGKNREGNIKGGPENTIEEQKQFDNQHQADLVAEAQEAAEPDHTPQTRPMPSLRIDALIAKRAGTVAMTGPAAELSDMFYDRMPEKNPFLDNPNVHIIKP